MLPRSAPRWPFLLAYAALAASVAALVTTTAQSPTDMWWTGCGSGPDHSRYVPSKQITRRNVSRLQVAWTYQFGDTGVLSGAGRDNAIRACDTDTGAQLWSARFGGDFVGSPVMYETAGRQYLLVPAASTPPRGPGAGTTGPLGWVAFALPLKE